jgi:trimeric autotransporter adhesin
MSTKRSIAVIAMSVGAVAAQAGTGTFTYNTSPNVAVAPDNGCTSDTAGNGSGGITHTVNLTDAGTIQDLNLELNLTQTWRSDIQVGLSYSGGGTIQVINNFDTSGDNLSLILDDEGVGLCSSTTHCGAAASTNCVTPPGPVCQPDAALSAFDGLATPGVLTITVCDRATGDFGNLVDANVTATLDIVALSADLSITKTDGVTTVAQGGSTTYTITASNAGPDATTGATVADTFPADCTAVSWTCAGAGGGTCTAAGAGNINDTVNLPSGASVIYTAACTISGTAASPLVNTATVTAPAGVTDPTPANNSATDSDTVSADVAPQFAYAPAAPGPVNFTGGTTVGSIATGTITVSIGTAGAGSGAAATTTTTCTAPGGFTGFGQSVTAIGADAATSGGPLTGTCTLAAMANTQSMTCIENRGGTPTTVNFDLTCPAGSAVVVDSFPTSGTTVTLPTQNLGGPATTTDINFFVNGAGSTTVNCTAPVATEFTVAPLSFPVGPATTTITYSSLVAGTFNGQLDCTAGAQNFTFPLVGTTVGGQATAIPVLGEGMRYWLMLAMLGLGIAALGVYSRRS